MDVIGPKISDKIKLWKIDETEIRWLYPYLLDW